LALGAGVKEGLLTDLQGKYLHNETETPETRKRTQNGRQVRGERGGPNAEELAQKSEKKGGKKATS